MPQLIIKRSDGGVSMGPMETGADPAAEVAKWAESSGLTAVSWRVSDASVTHPTDRTFRDAWTDDNPGDQVDVDMPKARTIHMNRIRVVRDAELAKLDIAWSRAMAKGVGADVIEAKRQKLRDLPQTFDLTSSATPEELKAMWPNELPKT